ncbi:glutamic-type intramembrane protease PrsW [Lentibacillus saliphilus]|uniref:glutamic-type intramembrane protease PrsW n=1 Tax=Lentibacillus saliphilus TaxID=2737028 RepID=UPI001C2FBD9A|nr:glutamic-type intramembrane protease PrsW [Lentibacillus saliphilus]
MFAVLSASLAPAIALMSFFYLKDKYAEPLPLIIKMFLWGVLVVFPIMFLQYAIGQEGWVENEFFQSFIVASFSEEFFKWFIFMYMIYHHAEFDTHYDGIVYAVAISLGFATFENVLYLMTNGIEYAVTRALFPVSSHALFGVIMGYYFGKAKMNATYKKSHITMALLFPFILHGTYNYILKASASNWVFILVPFMLALWMVCMRRVKIAAESSHANHDVIPITTYKKNA